MTTPCIVRVPDFITQHTGVAPDQMVHARYARLGQDLLAMRTQCRDGIATREAWAAERALLRSRLLAALGPGLPSEPAAGKIVGETACDGFTLQRLLYLSHPETWVPANLYLPTAGHAPFPCIVMPPGHSQSGKDAYLALAAYYCMNGYAVLTLDFLGEGERQLGGGDGVAPLFSSDAHNLQALKMEMDGINMNWFMCHDLRRAVDYLLTRPEIDPTRLAMTGGSGGGTATFYGGALDERIAVLAPVTAVHSLHARFLADDAEQTFFDHARLGLDYQDVGTFLIAPRPCLIVANTRDIWPLEGTQYVHDAMKRLYRMLGAEAAIDIVVRDGEHGWGPPEFAKILAWFDRWLGHAAPVQASWEDAQLRLPAAEACRVSSSGNIYRDGYRTPDATVRAALPASPARDDGYLAALLGQALPDSVRWEEVDRYRVNDLDGRRLIVFPEEGLLIPVEVIIPPHPMGVALLLDEISRLDAPDWQLVTARRGLVAIRPDMRGFGDTAPEETWPDWENWHRALYNGRRYTLWASAALCGRHLVLDRGRDALATLEAVHHLGFAGPLTLWGRRSGAPVALFAALALDLDVQLVLEHCPASYRELLDGELPPYPHDYLVHGLLRAGWDLPALCDRVRGHVTRILAWAPPQPAP